MEQSNNRMLSLGSWPTQPIPHQNIRLSPITQRLFNSTQVDFKSLLPLSLYQYSCQHLLPPNSPACLEAFQFDEARRMKMIAILQGMRSKRVDTSKDRKIIKSVSSISLHSSARIGSIKPSRKKQSSGVSRDRKAMLKFSGSKLKKSTSQSSTHLKKSTEPLKRSKPKLTLTQSDYFSQFGQPKKPQLIEQQSSQSTKSRHQPQNQYFPTPYNNKLRIRKQTNLSRRSKDSSQQVCSDLVRIMNQWEKVEEQHLQQRKQMDHLSKKERERLCKMQQVEIKEIQDRIRILKDKLNSQSGV